MPTGSCFCKGINLEYTGEPAMTVRLRRTSSLKHADPLGGPAGYGPGTPGGAE